MVQEPDRAPLDLARQFTLDRTHPSSIVTSIRLARDNARPGPRDDLDRDVGNSLDPPASICA
jgi:uncharacterized alpha-E superfamily protein